jgi:bile acid:Na+ symporter, BASS family
MRESILLLVLAVMVYAVALHLRPTDFRDVTQHPKAVVIGLIAQFVLLPVLTWAMTLALWWRRRV